MALSLKQLNDVCLVNETDSSKCRYVAQDDNVASLWFCLKNGSKKSEIDNQIKEHLDELKKKGIDPHGQPIPLGDNCRGYPVLRYIQQGYDQ